MNTKQETVSSIIGGLAGNQLFPAKGLASIETQQMVYKRFFNEFLSPLSKEQVDLLAKKGFQPNDSVKYGIHSVKLAKPLSELMKEFGGGFTGIPGFYRNGAMLLSTLPEDDSILCEVKDFWGKTVGGHIRLEDGTYTYWSSAKQGLPTSPLVHYSGYLEETIIVTEGALKANLINKLTGRYTAGLLDGKGASALLRDLRSMKKDNRGVKRVLLAFDQDDRDKKGFDSTELEIMESLPMLGYSVSRVTWDEKFKGLDDYLLTAQQQGQLRSCLKNVLESHYLHR